MRFTVLSVIAGLSALTVGCGSQSAPVDSRFAATQFCQPVAGAQTMARVIRAHGSMLDASLELGRLGQASTTECGELIGEYLVEHRAEYSDVLEAVARHQACMDDLRACD